MPTDNNFLWINLLDLDSLGHIPGFGTPLNLMLRPDLGDNLLDGAFCQKKLDRMDEVFLVVGCTEDRATAIKDCLEMLGKRKIKRVVRTRITADNSKISEAW